MAIFSPTPVEFHEMGAGIGVVQGGEEAEVDVSLADVGGGAVEEGCSVTKPAVARLASACLGEGFGRGVGVEERGVGEKWGERLAEAFPEAEGNLPDVGNLFERGGDEGGEAFPERLAEDAQAGAVGDGFAEGMVVLRKRLLNGGDVVVEGEVVDDVGCHFLWSDAEAVGCLFQINRGVADGAEPSIAERMPVEGLAGVDGGVEVEWVKDCHGAAGGLCQSVGDE